MVAIRTTQLTKRFGSHLAVDDLSLSVERGEVFGFLGPNGAGKSTTIDMLFGYVRPTSGSATVLGYDPTESIHEIRRRSGILPDGVALYDRLTGREHLEFAVDAMAAEDDPDAVLQRVGLDDAADRPAETYSAGMRQRLGLGLALVGDPELLVLDEPTNGLDPHGVAMLRDVIRTEAERGTTVFVSSHVLPEVEAVADRIGIVDEGRLVAVDSIDGLRAATDATTTVQLQIDPSTPDDATDALRTDLESLDAVDSVELAADVVRVTCDDSSSKGRIIAQAENSSVRVSDVSIEEATLEAVFDRYTDGSASGMTSDDERSIDDAESNAAGPADETERAST